MTKSDWFEIILDAFSKSLWFWLVFSFGFTLAQEIGIQ